MENINHRNYYLKKEPVIKQPVVKKPSPPSYDEIFDLTKSEQEDRLKSLGLSKKQIKKLKYEKDRVDKILELSGD